MTDLVLPKLLDDNPWQVRGAPDPAYLRALADDIQARGLLNPPRVRPHPTQITRYQIASGHNRRSAWALACPDQPMPVYVAALDDRAMAEEAIAENVQRLDLNPVERARALQRYLDEFKATQAEAAKLFGLESQGAVSNILRLLRLPADVLAVVARGELAERDARRLVPVVRFDPKQVSALVKEAVQAKPDERGDVLEISVNRWLWKDARSLNNADWRLDWPQNPIPVAVPQAGEPDSVPACRGCEFNVQSGQSFCIRPACFDLKVRLYHAHALQSAAKKLGLPVAGADEKTTIVFDGTQYGAHEKVRGMLKAKLPCLRLAVNEKHGDSWSLKEVIGAQHVMLVTTDRAAVEAWRSGDKKAALKNEPPAKAAQRQAQEKIEQDARRDERAAMLKAKYDVSWLIVNASQRIGERLAISGGVLDMLVPEINYHIFGFELLNRFETDLEKQIDAAKGDARAALRRTQIAFRLVCGQVAHHDHRNNPEYDWDHTADKISDLAGAGGKWQRESFNVKLPAGWNRAPIHQTEFNCWQCGTFASSEKLTKRDQAEGWGRTDKGVHCPACGKAAKKNKKK